MTVDGKPVVTLAQFAERRGVAAGTVRATWTRAQPQPEPAAHVDGRTPVFFVRDLERMYRQR